MPVEAAPGQAHAREVGTHLEALGRLLSGLAPWLELEPTTIEDPNPLLKGNHDGVRSVHFDSTNRVTSIGFATGE